MIRGLVAAAVAVAVPATGIAGQEPAGRRAITVTETQIAELRGTDELVDALLRNDELRLASRTPDRYLPARVHEGLMQYHEGVPVLGGGLSRQLAGGVTVSIFGTLHEGIDVDTTPLVSADDALGLIGRSASSGFGIPWMMSRAAAQGPAAGCGSVSLFILSLGGRSVRAAVRVAAGCSGGGASRAWWRHVNAPSR